MRLPEHSATGFQMPIRWHGRKKPSAQAAGDGKQGGILSFFLLKGAEPIAPLEKKTEKDNIREKTGKKKELLPFFFPDRFRENALFPFPQTGFGNRFFYRFSC